MTLTLRSLVLALVLVGSFSGARAAGLEAHAQSPSNTPTAAQPAPQDVSQAPAAGEVKSDFDIDKVAHEVRQMREERTYLVTLKFKKQELHFSPTAIVFSAVKNAITAKEEVIAVGERSFGDYVIDQNVSTQNDVAGFLLGTPGLARYVAFPTAKEIVRNYFWVNQKDESHEVTQEQYLAVLAKLQADGRNLHVVSPQGRTITYVLPKPLEKYKSQERVPLMQYYVLVQVHNSSISLSLSKFLRNATNDHTLVIEVPKETYDRTGELWDPTLNIASLFLKGRLSTLHGKVMRKWAEVDDAFWLTRMTDGTELIIAQAQQNNAKQAQEATTNK